MPAADTATAAARSRIGCRYRWGAAGPDEFDCSGLIVWAYQQAGIALPRTSQQLANTGQPVPRTELQPGDIIIYYPDASHVGLYTGAGNVIHASTYGIPVQEVPIDAAGPYNHARRTTQEKHMTLFYPDVSNNNWATPPSWTTPQDAIDFCSQLADEGFSAVCHKVSEGNYYKDPYWTPVRQWCQSNNFVVFGYHYVTTNDPTSQAATWLSNVGDRSLPCMLDFEANSGDITNFWAVANAFNTAGVRVALSYIPRWYWQQIGSPDLSHVPGLVSSSYFQEGKYASVEYYGSGGDGGQGWAPYGGASPVVWQFTDAAIINGHRVDCNAFRGSLDDFKQLLGITTGDTAISAANSTPNPPAIPKPADEPTQASQTWDQLLTRWDFAGNRTLAELIAAVGQKLGVPGCVDLKGQTQ